MTSPLIIFRADASIDIGTGHVMRCLTLADALATQGAECQFICRSHKGHLIEVIRGKGYTVHDLPPVFENSPNQRQPQLAHEAWLGCSQADDAAQCTDIIKALRPQWLVVDHYALDIQWEKVLQPHCTNIMVIDDLADRHHQCHLLLDQNLGRNQGDYHCLVPKNCILLCGPKYALLRPEFSQLRPYSLKRRHSTRLQKILITLGGVDKNNITSVVLDALASCPLPADCQIIVVMGSQAPWLAQVHEQASHMPWPTTVLTNVSDMALIMASSDLAIGAAGSTSWERCCLALPSIQITLAGNQRLIARSLDLAKAAIAATPETLPIQLYSLVIDEANCLHTLNELSRAAAKVTDGYGVHRVADFLNETT